MDNVLITGGAGYIGSTLVNRIRNNYNLTVIDKFLFNNPSVLNQAFMTPGFIFKNLDLIKDELDLKGIDTIVHLSAIVGDYACEVCPEHSYKLNVEVTKKLAEEAKWSGVKRFIFASSCSNYGLNEGKLVNEDSELNPISEYAKHKIECEEYILGLEDKFFKPVCLRFGTAYGLSYHTRFDLLINSLVYEAVKYGKIIVYGTELIRPWIHVKDIARAINTFMKTDHTGIWNIGFNSQVTTKKELIDILLEHVRPLEVIQEKESKDRRSYNVSFDKYEKEFSHYPSRGLESGIYEMIEGIQSGLISEHYFQTFNQSGLTEIYRGLE